MWVEDWCGEGGERVLISGGEYTSIPIRFAQPLIFTACQVSAVHLQYIHASSKKSEAYPPSTAHPTHTPTSRLLSIHRSSNSKIRRILLSCPCTCRCSRRRGSSWREGARSRLRCCWPRCSSRGCSSTRSMCRSTWRWIGSGRSMGRWVSGALRDVMGVWEGLESCMYVSVS
jgi:hypothetical protein